MHVALYIHSSYIVLGILSHQGTICKTQGDVSRFICKHHAILRKGFQCPLILVSVGNSGANPFCLCVCASMCTYSRVTWDVVGEGKWSVFGYGK